MNDLARLRRLPSALTGAIAPVLAAAANEGLRVALVGGVVRDRLLGLPPGRDIDFVVEGAGDRVAALARRVAGESEGSRLRIHERFGTATIETAAGWRIDLAGARGETYPRPGALPEVRGATIEEDLERRDFTVHAMAWEPRPGSSGGGRLHDPFRGAADLESRLLRILHGDSFRDDPTRALRAVRYANRLGFRIERGSRRALASALAAGALDAVSGDRIRQELERTLSEPNAAGALGIAARLGVLAAIDPAWTAGTRVLAAVRRGEDLASRMPGRPGPAGWLTPLLISSAGLMGRERDRFAARLGLAGGLRRTFDDFARREREAESFPRSGRSPAVSEDLALPARIAEAAWLPRGRARRDAEGRLFRPAAPLAVRGADLLAAGIPPGPHVGRALAETARARVEGRLSPPEELPFAIAAARRTAG